MRLRLLLALALCAGVLPCQGVAQVPQLVADIAPAAGARLGMEREVALLGGHVFYAAEGVAGVELYRAPLAGTGRQLVKDICPGPGSATPFGLTVVGAELFFAANDGVHGVELWRTDGSAANTLMVRDIHPGLASSQWEVPTRRVAMGCLNSRVLFGANDGRTGVSLWSSDGTAAGTVLVKDLYPGTGLWPVDSFVAFAGVLLFTAANGTDHELWVTDGSAGGTRQLATLRPYLGSAAPAPTIAVHGGNGLYLGGRGALYQVTSVAGSIVTRKVHFGPADHVPFCAVDPSGRPGFGGVLFAHQATLLYTDGARLDSMRLRYGLSSYEQVGAAAPPECCFFGFDLQHGNELWKSDGTAAGTRLLRDIRPGPLDASPPGSRPQLEVSGNGFFFAADDGVHGEELWFSDGSQQGTRLVVDLDPGASPSRPRRLTAVSGGGVVFVADHPQHGVALWHCAGPGAGPGAGAARLLDAQFAGDAGVSADDHVRGLTEHAGLLYFAADDGRRGTELWRTDGTASGTLLVQDIDPTGSALREHDLAGGSMHGMLQAERLGNDLLFTAYQSGNRLGLFASGGTPTTTRLVAGLSLRSASAGYPLAGVAVDEGLFFSAFDASGGGLWRTAGTAASTRRLVSGIEPQGMVRLGRQVVFAARPGGSTVVYASDGTPAGTVALASLSSPGTAAEMTLVPVGRLVCFGGDGHLWSTDGTPAGTRRVTPARVEGLAEAAGWLLVLDYGGGSTAVGLSDGVSAWPLVWNLPGRPDGLRGVGDRVFFSLLGAAGSELWVSDGSVAGTLMLRSFPHGATVPARVRGLTALGARRVAFTVDHDPHFGSEVWESDGTAPGTRVIADIHPGPAGSSPTGFAVADGRLYVVADAAGLGRRELYRLEIGASAAEFGPGVAASGYVARLRATDPWLGGALDLAIDDAPPRAAGLLLIGRPATPSVDLSNGVFLHVDPGFWARLPIVVDPAGRFRLLGASVPAHPALRGFRLVAQAAVGPTAQAPLGLDLTDAVLLVPQ